MINFYIPDFYYQYNLNIKLITLLKDHPEYFYDNIGIGAVYGTFPGAIWNGGRWLRGITTSDNIKATIEGFNNLNIPVRFTFTNCLLDDMHVYDAYCNLIMKCADNGQNEVLVNSESLENYLRNRYPNFKYILSTTKCERNIDKINEACSRYDLVVTDYRDNTNDEFLNGLIDKNKIELLINAYCPPTCTQRLKHYSILSENQLNFSDCKHNDIDCNAPSNSFFDILKYPTVIKVCDLYGKYVDMGFSNFKIEGRTLHAMDIIESYVYYMVKPEFKDKIRYTLVRSVWN